MSFSQLLSTSTSLFGVRSSDTPYRMRKGTLLPKFEPVKNPFALPPKPEPASMADGTAAQSPQAPGSRRGPWQTSLLFEENPGRPASVAECVPSVPSLACSSSGAKGGQSGAPEADLPKLVPVYSSREAVRLKPIAPARPETLVARVGSGAAAKEPPPVRDGAAAPPPAKPAKDAPVVGLMDASPLGLKTGVAPKAAEPARAPAAPPEAKSNFLAVLLGKLNPAAYFRNRPVAKPRLRPWQTRSVVQAELSLENVKVIRNDLNDTDLEFVPARAAAKSAAPNSLLQPMTRGENTAFGRFASRFFGPGQPQVR